MATNADLFEDGKGGLYWVADGDAAAGWKRIAGPEAAFYSDAETLLNGGELKGWQSHDLTREPWFDGSVPVASYGVHTISMSHSVMSDTARRYIRGGNS
jgi:hypothetical protein